MQALSFDNEELKITEPFKGLFTQGMVCHETYKDNENNWLSPEEITTIDGNKYLKKDNTKKVIIGPSESMSKSKKNTIDPETIIENFGADAVRLFILSDSPPEKDVQWSDEGIEASHKFIQKLWTIHQKICDEINKNHPEDSSQNLEKFTNKFIKNITQNLNNFNYNIVIANLHEIYTFLSKEIKNKYKQDTLVNNYKKILICMLPIIPHLSNEALKNINSNEKTEWPKYDEELLVEEKINYVVQVNGRKRGLVQTDRDISEEDLIKLILNEENLKKYISNQEFKRKIFVQGKLINIII
tara:strand:- start:551 stop:1447 length:897 start_codon:yes stop_codon:yes gene_type:complete